MRKSLIPIEIFNKRRSQLAPKIKGAALILGANPEVERNHDVSYDYRQDTNFFYLTGFEEPDSVFVFRPGCKPETVMFVRKKDPLRETWDGFRFGPEGAKKEFGMDATYEISELSAKLPDLLKDVEEIYYPLKKNPELDEVIHKALHETKVGQGRTGRGLLTVHDPNVVIGEMRLFKSEEEKQWLRKTGEISALAHIDAMKFTKPGVNERQIMGVIYNAFYQHGSQRVGYGAIVASGNSACTLHYKFNDQDCKDGDLILIDAGSEYNYYSGDITRTFPVNGKFTNAQKQVYEKVLYVQKAIIKMIKPGILFEELQNTTIDMLTSAMLELKLLKGKKEELITNKEFRRYYMHGVSHWLGMDVHDAGLYQQSGKSRMLEPGMCFTVEPGLYIPSNDMQAPAEYRGIGIRIEDDIIVTTDGCEVITSKVPKEINEIEALMAR